MRSLIRIFTARNLDSQGCKVCCFFFQADNEDSSDCADAQGDLSSFGARQKLRFLTLGLKVTLIT